MCLSAPLFLATMDDGPWFAMMFCAATTPFLAPPKGCELNLQRGGLALVEPVLLPSHCCTYEPSQILAFVPYNAASQWKALVLHGLALMPSPLA